MSSHQNQQQQQQQQSTTTISTAAASTTPTTTAPTTTPSLSQKSWLVAVDDRSDNALNYALNSSSADTTLNLVFVVSSKPEKFKNPYVYEDDSPSSSSPSTTTTNGATTLPKSSSNSTTTAATTTTTTLKSINNTAAAPVSALSWEEETAARVDALKTKCLTKCNDRFYLSFSTHAFFKTLIVLFSIIGIENAILFRKLVAGTRVAGALATVCARR